MASRLSTAGVLALGLAYAACECPDDDVLFRFEDGDYYVGGYNPPDEVTAEDFVLTLDGDRVLIEYTLEDGNHVTVEYEVVGQSVR